MPKKIGFARGFHLPTPTEIQEALGENSPFNDELQSTFDPIPSPTDTKDWLAKYKVQGQSYIDYLEECPYIDDGDSTRTTIYLTLLDNDDRRSLLDVDRLIDYTQRFFQMPVKVLPLFTQLIWNDKTRAWICKTNQTSRHFPAEIQLDTRYDESTGHSQILVPSVLGLLRYAVPSDARCLVAITMQDFYSDPTDLFIAGLSHGNRRVAAFSFFRYDPRLTFGDVFWYDWRLKKSQAASLKTTILLRSCRLLTHEIGHLLGLDHCIYYACLMNGSGHLKEDFSQPLFLCPVDLRKLARLSQLDFVQHYEQLLQFCIDNRFTDEIEILQKRLDILKNLALSSVSRKRKRTNERSKGNKKRSKK